MWTFDKKNNLKKDCVARLILWMRSCRAVRATIIWLTPQELKNKLLFSVVVLAFRSVLQSVQSLKNQVKRTLQVKLSNHGHCYLWSKLSQLRVKHSLNVHRSKCSVFSVYICSCSWSVRLILMVYNWWLILNHGMHLQFIQEGTEL